MFVCYLLVASTKFYALGFMMATEQADPLASKYWPLMVCVFHVCGPSTNFYLAGNLIYPYFPRGFDRSLYALGAIMGLFFIDRVGRFGDSIHMPNFFYFWSLILYLSHTLFTAIFVAVGVKEVEKIFMFAIL